MYVGVFIISSLFVLLLLTEGDDMSICSFGSRADLNKLIEEPIPSWVQVGEPVIVLSSQGGQKSGTVIFIGNTEFASGNWVGVALDTPDGNTIIQNNRI